MAEGINTVNEGTRGRQITPRSLSPRYETGETLRAEGQGEATNPNEEYPSSLRSCSSTCTSYSLEISLSTNDNNSSRGSQPLPLQTPLESRHGQGQQTSLYGPVKNHFNEKIPDVSLTAPHRTSDPNQSENRGRSGNSIASSISQCTDKLGSCRIVTSKNTEFGTESKLEAQPISINHPKSPPSQSLRLDYGDSKESKVSEDEIFYAFVILHSPEDTDEAIRIKDRLESVSDAVGATFSEDFAEPGRSTFRCVEDAIHNSALVMLLLTSNFKTRLNETSADAALMNSIEKPHKYNTVIPLLPRGNGLRKEDFPLVLRSKIPLDENSASFETKAKKVLALKKIQNQKEIWKDELLIQKQREKQQSLQEENRRQMDFNREAAAVRDLKQQKMFLLSQQQQNVWPPQSPQAFSYQTLMGGPQHFGPVPPQCHHQIGESWQQPASNIHIQNAKYIMIGNDSTMTVGGGADSSGDEDWS